MDDLWGNLNNKVPNYFNEIAEKFSLKFVKVNRIKTALANRNFALLISIDRFSANIDYIMRDKNGELIKYNCDSFFAEKYDGSDRKQLMEGKNAEELIINEFIISKNGLMSKWSGVLKGNAEWIDEFKKSKWYNVRKAGNQELKVLENFIK